MRERRRLLVTILILLLILGGLIYLYISISRPPVIVAPTEKGLTYLRSIYGFGPDEKSQLKSPLGIGADKRGRLFIADSQHFRVLIFDVDGRYLGQLGKYGTGRGEIAHPEGVDVDSDGNIYVADTSNQKVLVFGPDLKFKNEVAEMYPTAVFVKGNRVYIATRFYISIRNRDLKELDRWGGQGRNVGQFDSLRGIAVLKNNTVVVSDANNMRLQALLNGRGDVAWLVGSPPKSMSDPKRAFGLPGGLAIDQDENIYVVDSFRFSIQIFNSKGKKLTELGQFGTKEGQFNYPSDIAYLGNRLFAITDTYNNRVQIVRLTIP